MRDKIKIFFSSGPLGALVGVVSALLFSFLKLPVMSLITGLSGAEPASLEGSVIPMVAFPVYFGAAMLLGYVCGLFGGLLRRRTIGIIIGGLVAGLLLNLFVTIK